MIKIGQSAAKLLNTFEMNGYEERSTTKFPEAWDDEGALKRRYSLYRYESIGWKSLTGVPRDLANHEES